MDGRTGQRQVASLLRENAELHTARVSLEWAIRAALNTGDQAYRQTVLAEALQAAILGRPSRRAAS